MIFEKFLLKITEKIYLCFESTVLVYIYKSHYAIFNSFKRPLLKPLSLKVPAFKVTYYLSYFSQIALAKIKKESKLIF